MLTVLKSTVWWRQVHSHCSATITMVSRFMFLTLTTAIYIVKCIPESILANSVQIV